MKSLTRGGGGAPTSAKCGECHSESYNEWRASTHAAAWTDPAFVKETENHQVQDCLPCHAPETIFSTKEQLKLRTAHLDEGINCIACHLIEGKQHGPFVAGAFTPHATQADPELFRNAALCGKCHAGTYATWQASRAADPKVPTCQQCHMKPVRRKITQPTGILSRGIVALHSERDLRRHDFSPVISPERPAVALEIRIADGVGIVTARNLLPHAIPEGDFGFRRAVLSAHLLDGTDKPLASVSKDFDKENGTELPPGKSAELRLPPGLTQGARIRARLARMHEDGSIGLVIAETSHDLILLNSKH